MRFREEEFEGLRKLIYDKEGVDIGLIKRPLVERKLMRRMNELGIESMEKYLPLLESEEERKRFMNSLLIGVTSFMRNYDVYKCFAEKVFPEVHRGYEGSDVIKVMSIGCATGEEVYSILFILIQSYGENILERVRIYGVDMDSNSLGIAESGIYTKKDIEVLPEDWIDRFFVKDGENYSIRNDLKGVCKFYCINLLKENLPPVMSDVVFLRNFLIFFTSKGKIVILKKVNAVLKEGGFIILGKSETGFSFSGLEHNYISYCLEHRIFRKGGAI